MAYDMISAFDKAEMDRRKFELKMQFLEESSKCYSTDDMDYIMAKLETLDDKHLERLILHREKSPNLGLVLAIFFGLFGVDRFYLKDNKIGIIKLCTLGLFFVRYFLDIKNIRREIYAYNLKSFNKIVEDIKE